MSAKLQSIENAPTKEDGTVRLTYNEKFYAVPMEFFLKEHPGGKLVLSAYKNGDITEEFDLADHSYDAKEMLEEWCEENSEEEKLALQKRAAARQARLDEWRWRSTAIAFSVLTIAAAITLKYKPSS